MRWNASPKGNAEWEEMSFPSFCPRCLTENDLTSYTLPYRRYLPPKKKEMEIPICESCKKAAVWEHRKFTVIASAVWVPLCWGLLIILVSTGFLWKIIEALGLPWGFIPPFVLVFTPFYALYLLVRSFLPPAQGVWPVAFEEEDPSAPLSFENETYVKKFVADNIERLEYVWDSAASPIRHLIYMGEWVEREND